MSFPQWCCPLQADDWRTMQSICSAMPVNATEALFLLLRNVAVTISSFFSVHSKAYSVANADWVMKYLCLAHGNRRGKDMEPILLEENCKKNNTNSNYGNLAIPINCGKCIWKRKSIHYISLLPFRVQMLSLTLKNTEF